MFEKFFLISEYVPTLFTPMKDKTDSETVRETDENERALLKNFQLCASFFVHLHISFYYRERILIADMWTNGLESLTCEVKFWSQYIIYQHSEKWDGIFVSHRENETPYPFVFYEIFPTYNRWFFFK